MVASAAIGGTLQYGYNLAIMNAPTVVSVPAPHQHDSCTQSGSKLISGDPTLPTQVTGSAVLMTCTCLVHLLTVWPVSSQFIQTFVNETFLERWDLQLEDYQVTLVWTVIVSIFSLGGLIGALIAGPMTIRFGR